MFEINESADGKFYFNLKADNGEIIATSEMYESKQAAEHGIDSVRRNAPVSEIKGMSQGGALIPFPSVTRVEVITKQGRQLALHGCDGVELSFQDDERTLKVFC